MIHNPVFLPEDIRMLADLVRSRDLDEDQKYESREKIAARIRLLHEVIRTGLERVLDETK